MLSEVTCIIGTGNDGNQSQGGTFTVLQEIVACVKSSDSENRMLAKQYSMPYFNKCIRIYDWSLANLSYINCEVLLTKDVKN